MLSTPLAFSKTLIFIDNSVSNDTYIASNKERQISSAFKLGLIEVRKKCPIKDLQLIGKEPLSIFEQEKKVKLIKDTKMIFGLIHSSEALLAAEAFKSSGLLSLSSGAASNTLNQKNPNFFSLANSISKVSEHVSGYISLKKVKTPIAIIPGNSSYSIELAKSLKENLSKMGINLEIKLIDTNMNHQDLISKELSLKKYDFVYVPGFLQQTLPIFESISKFGFNGIVYGSANLARSKTDLKLFSSSLKTKSLDIRFPATWLNGETKNSKVLEKKFEAQNNEEIMGTAIYTYDAVLISGTFLCEVEGDPTSQKFIDFIKRKVLQGKLDTVRKYNNIDNGHLESSIVTVRFNVKNQQMIQE
jgi:ABC-type branched-subunit amino acid transport system substrate-binding protein